MAVMSSVYLQTYYTRLYLVLVVPARVAYDSARVEPAHTKDITRLQARPAWWSHTHQNILSTYRPVSHFQLEFISSKQLNLSLSRGFDLQMKTPVLDQTCICSPSNRQPASPERSFQGKRVGASPFAQHGDSSQMNDTEMDHKYSKNLSIGCSQTKSISLNQNAALHPHASLYYTTLCLKLAPERLTPGPQGRNLERSE
jgi:hypothetical protein